MFDHMPYTNFHEINLDWIIQKVKEAYSPDNPPENVVLSVNGLTGDVVLYSSEDVQFPAVEDSVWTIHRRIDGSNSGLLFIKGNKVQRIDGTTKYDIYDTGNPPPYPVSSVNGATGDIILYPNAQIMLPTVVETAWNIFRTADSVATGIQFNKNSPAQRINGIDRFAIYDAGNPPPYPVTSVNGQTGAVNLTFPVTSVNGQTGAVVLTFPVTSVNGQTGDVSIPQLVNNVSADYLHITQDATGDEWAVERGIPSGTTALRIEVNNGHVEAYLDFTDTTDTVVDSFKLLTTQDIPSSAGVVSVNGSAGVVVLTGSDIAVSSGDSTTIATKLSNLQNSKANQDTLAFMEPGDTATQNIPSGRYVYWKGNMYKSSSAISQYDTLSLSNLTPVSPNALNDLQGQVSSLSDHIANLLPFADVKDINSSRNVVITSSSTAVRGLILIHSNDVSRTAMLMFQGTSSAWVITEISKGTNISYSISGNTLTISNNTASNASVFMLFVQGNKNNVTIS